MRSANLRRERAARPDGHVPAAFHVAAKILWIRANEPDVFKATRLFLATHGVPRADAHRRGRHRLDDGRGERAARPPQTRSGRPSWSRHVGLELAQLPVPHPSWSVVGELRPSLVRRFGLAATVPVVAGAGDSIACAFGAGVTSPGPVSEMAGSSTCLNTVVSEPTRDLAITHYPSAVGPDGYVTEVGINTAGEAVDWLASLTYGGRSGRPRAADFEQLDREACEVAPGSDGLLFVPVLGDGERDDPRLRGAAIGLSVRHDRRSLARAALEGVAFAIRAHVEALGAASTPATEMRVSGRPASLRTWNHIKADVLGIPVSRVPGDATTSGVAMLAGTRRRHLPGCEIGDCDRLPSRRRRSSQILPITTRYTTLYEHYRRRGVLHAPHGCSRRATRCTEGAGESQPRHQHLLRAETLAAPRGLGVRRAQRPRARSRRAVARPRRGHRDIRRQPRRRGASSGRARLPTGCRRTQPSPASRRTRSTCSCIRTRRAGRRRCTGTATIIDLTACARSPRDRRARRGDERSRLERPRAPRRALGGPAARSRDARRTRRHGGTRLPPHREPGVGARAVDDGADRGAAHRRRRRPRSVAALPRRRASVRARAPTERSAIRTRGCGASGAASPRCSCSRRTASRDHHWAFTAEHNATGIIEPGEGARDARGCGRGNGRPDLRDHPRLRGSGRPGHRRPPRLGRPVAERDSTRAGSGASGCPSCMPTASTSTTGSPATAPRRRPARQRRRRRPRRLGDAGRPACRRRSARRHVRQPRRRALIASAGPVLEPRDGGGYEGTRRSRSVCGSSTSSACRWEG